MGPGTPEGRQGSPPCRPSFDGNRFNGDVAPALRELQESGVVRILDLTFVNKGPDGSVSVVEPDDAVVVEAFRRLTGEGFDLISDEDLTRVAEQLPDNSSAVVLVRENTWASRLATALRESDGQVVLMERIPRAEVVRAITALDEEG
ncbi:DUF1269 domain-containing protein [Streptomyces sp. DK15]|uniref:DUF6325 family protein n=1 Tax=Streptomyces sp. DK15 TaxID=2957499 RepID=UPI0029A31314|nr:DUF6325 family protein [Streptomyces sp. DK15]MDX2395119.1 DUF1269 domain-containing protein [Streptomyces sp. DK15]